MAKTLIIRMLFYSLSTYYCISFNGHQRVILFGNTADWFPIEIQIKTPFSKMLTYGFEYYIEHKAPNVNPNAIPLRLKFISFF